MTAPPRAAAFLSGGGAPGAALQAFTAAEALPVSQILLRCCDGISTTAPDERYEVVLAASSAPHSRDALARVARAMAPGGRLYVFEPVASPSSQATDNATRSEAVCKDLLLSGFVDAEEAGTSGAPTQEGGPWVWVSRGRADGLTPCLLDGLSCPPQLTCHEAVRSACTRSRLTLACNSPGPCAPAQLGPGCRRQAVAQAARRSHP
jgi:hypothetical protein